MSGADSTQELGVVAGVTLVLFNLLTILSVEREIGALWSSSDGQLHALASPSPAS